MLMAILEALLSSLLALRQLDFIGRFLLQFLENLGHFWSLANLKTLLDFSGTFNFTLAVSGNLKKLFQSFQLYLDASDTLSK